MKCYYTILYCIDDVHLDHIAYTTSAAIIDAPTESSIRVINVLIVDDSAACRMMTKRSFTVIDKEGCQICSDQASDGQQAVEMVKSFTNHESSSLQTSESAKQQLVNTIASKRIYDLILMDYQMPHMDGPTAIRNIRELGYQGQIVGLTGNVLGTEIETMRQAGANKVLSKPVQLTDIESLIMEL